MEIDYIVAKTDSGINIGKATKEAWKIAVEQWQDVRFKFNDKWYYCSLGLLYDDMNNQWKENHND